MTKIHFVRVLPFNGSIEPELNKWRLVKFLDSSDADRPIKKLMDNMIGLIGYVCKGPAKN